MEERRKRRDSLVPLILVVCLFAIVALATFSYGGPCDGWSPEEALVASQAGMYMYDGVPPSLALAVDRDGIRHLAYSLTKMYQAETVYGWQCYQWSELSYLNDYGVAKRLVSTYDMYKCPGDYLSAPAIAVDSAGRAAMAYGRADVSALTWTMYLVTDLADAWPVSRTVASGRFIWADPINCPWSLYCEFPPVALTFDPSDRWHIAYRALNWSEYDGLRMYHLSDGLLEVAAQFPGYPDWEDSPSISSDAGGALYLGYARTMPELPTTAEMVDNASGVWSEPRTLMTLIADTVNFYHPLPVSPSIAVNETGSPYIAWVDSESPVSFASDISDSVMSARTGAEACALADSLLMYDPPGWYGMMWRGERVGPAALARDPAGAWHVAYARSTPRCDGWWAGDAQSISNDRCGTWSIVDRYKWDTFTLTTAADPPNGGDVTGGGEYTVGDTATVEAFPAPGYLFSHWEGDLSGFGNPADVLMDSDKSITAVFVRTGNDTIGLYDASASKFYLRNTNAAGPADATFRFGPVPSSWIPISGDWDGDGVSTIGLYDPAASRFYLRNANAPGVADVSFRFGPSPSKWTPIAGDWDGDGIDSVGLYDPAASRFYLKNAHGAGIADLSFRFGPVPSAWLPITGDWDGDGVCTIGLYDPAASRFYVKNANGPGVADVSFRFGPLPSSWLPTAGDWNADGLETIGLYDPATSKFYLKNALSAGGADVTFRFGPAPSAWRPIAGNWDGQ